jgi:hypothetical protein
MESNAQRLADILERLGVAAVQPREDLSSHSDGDPGGGSVAEIQTDRTVHHRGDLFTARRDVF